jgi:hypothetical protein
MNIKVFKKLIKEAVIDAIHEELPYILEEHMVKQEKKALREGKTMSFTSTDVPTNSLPGGVRSQLAAQMGEAFGFQPQAPKLEVIKAVDESTGEPVNPYLAFINDAAANMTPMDRQGLRNLG